MQVWSCVVPEMPPAISCTTSPEPHRDEVAETRLRLPDRGPVVQSCVGLCCCARPEPLCIQTQVKQSKLGSAWESARPSRGKHALVQAIQSREMQVLPDLGQSVVGSGLETEGSIPSISIYLS